MDLGHIGAHALHNPIGRALCKGTAGATIGMATGSALTTVGATSLGGTVTSISTAAMGTAATALGGGTAVTSVIGAVGAASAAIGAVLPFVAGGYCIYKLTKWAFR